MRKVLVLSPYSTCRNWGPWNWSHLARANKGSNGDVKLDLCGNKALKHKRHLLPQIPLSDGNEFILIGWAPEEAGQAGPRTPGSLETGVRRRCNCWLPAPAEQYWGRGPRLVLTGSRGRHGGQGDRFQLVQSKSSWVSPPHPPTGCFGWWAACYCRSAIWQRLWAVPLLGSTHSVVSVIKKQIGLQMNRGFAPSTLIKFSR